MLNSELKVFAQKSIYSKHTIYHTNEYKEEFLDIFKNNYWSFSIYWNIKTSGDELLFESANLKCNLFIIRPNVLGREYSKTCSFNTTYKSEPKETIFEVLKGAGYFIIESQDDKKDVKVVKVKKGSFVLIPKNYAFTVINSSLSESLIVCSFMGKRTKLNIGVLRKNHGATLFYTKTGFIKNKNVTSTYNLEDYKGDYTMGYSFNHEKGLYKEFIEYPQKFDFLK